MASRANITAYKGGLLLVSGWEAPIVVDLTGLEIPAGGVPLLQDHDNATGSVLGRATVTNDGQELHAVGHLSKATQAARTVGKMLDEGMLLQASIGADIHEFDHIRPGQSVAVNRRRFEADERGLIVARKASLHEISVVPLGADTETSVSLAARLNFSAKGSRMPTATKTPTFEEYLASLELDPAELSEAALTALRSAYEAEFPEGDIAAQLDEDDEDDEEEPEPVRSASSRHRGTSVRHAQAGRDRRVISNSRDVVRVSRIKQIAAQYGDKDETRRPEVMKMARSSIVNGLSASAFKHRMLAAFAPTVGGPMTLGGYSAPERSILEASLAMTCGVPEEFVGKRYGERVANEAVSKRHRGAGLHSVLRACLRAAGDSRDSERIDGHFLKQAFTASRKLEAAGSTMSLPGILGNVANQSMLAAYEAVPATWEKFCRKGDNRDFRPHERYRLVGKGQFKKVGRGGELEHLQLGDSTYTNTLDTSGAMIEVSRQTLIDDRVDAFSQLPAMMGRMGAIEVDRAAFTLLMSNPDSFFSALKGNFQLGVDRALSLSALELAEQAFDNLVDGNGSPAMIIPRVLLVPVPLKTVGRTVINSERVNQATTAATPDGNPFKASFELVSSPWLTNAALPGTNKDKKWFLLAGPGDFSVLEVAFLNGQTVPTIESGEMDFSILGIQLRAYFDFGVAMLDYRGGVQMVGAAS
jgi:phage head maturation protease